MIIKSLKELDIIVEYCIRGGLPKEQYLFIPLLEKIKTDAWLKNLGSSCINTVSISDGIEADVLKYAGFTFYLITLDYVDEPHVHEWVESKTFFDGCDGRYILSHYCKGCKKTETYHGGNERWVKTGYIK